MPLTGNTDYKMYVKSNGFYAEPVIISTKGIRKSEIFADSLVLSPIDLKKAAIWRTILFKGKRKNILLNLYPDSIRWLIC